ncbi:MAG: type II toxin-antitoxin system VapC family toxin [Runella slithyformis]|jgi:PIN domain nuclease of toxin-antitoxin system|nr:MAG: type II toxin-antitoxin system VapC family toxin [Runella slithyformis]TAF94609.1 MAG: type II toxin-antitoxin system VapC family toxin [Runella sp.]TAG23925.1 MAG: type II toxin-antitoxin system VapC family toxin [Cytophagales bacterium]TAG34497.1 MAG: type II toxin-antitoxin system VapC family toxin [Cytophagia bacterium]TAF48570.1 MAG: type II toxin-antitoxin system VapC family toxin [Runella slithyformis]
MKYLLDTHSLIWFMKGDEKMPDKVRQVIAENHLNCFVSVASFWEMSIKISLNKLDIGLPFPEVEKWLFDNNLRNILPIDFRHTLQLSQLPFYHRDPFDRTLIAQALSENITLVSNEKIFDKYGVKRIWQ